MMKQRSRDRTPRVLDADELGLVTGGTDRCFNNQFDVDLGCKLPPPPPPPPPP